MARANKTTKTSRCKHVRGSALVPGWGCCKCGTYNGYQRKACKNCRHTACYDTQGSEGREAAELSRIGSSPNLVREWMERNIPRDKTIAVHGDTSQSENDMPMGAYELRPTFHKSGTLRELSSLAEVGLAFRYTGTGWYLNDNGSAALFVHAWGLDKDVLELYYWSKSPLKLLQALVGLTVQSGGGEKRLAFALSPEKPGSKRGVIMLDETDAKELQNVIEGWGRVVTLLGQLETDLQVRMESKGSKPSKRNSRRPKRRSVA